MCAFDDCQAETLKSNASALVLLDLEPSASA